MALRTIVAEGDEILRKQCKKVMIFDEKLEILVNDMKETLLHANGLGLAAPQIGFLKQIALIVDDNEEIITIINPEIVETKGEQISTEGCLSIPGIYGKLSRPAEVTLKAQDINGGFFTIKRDKITAVAICHETDHLKGVLFKDKVFEYVEEKNRK